MPVATIHSVYAIKSLLAAATIGMLGSFVIQTTTPQPAEASLIGSRITRAEVLARAQHWVDKGYRYSPNAPSSFVSYPDSAGTNYRGDCSGLISMAWHLNGSPSTSNFIDTTGTNWVDIGAKENLRPADAMVYAGHIELFSHWGTHDGVHGAFVYSFNTNNETVENPYADSNTGKRGFNSDADLGNFTKFIRYRYIVDGNAAVYGVVGDRTLSYTVVNASTGVRSSTVISSASLSFTPKAIATLNDNTVLITSGGNLYRVDITSKNPLTFNTPVFIDGGWTHDYLAYDGNGHLYGIAAGTLRRYDITTPKPPTGTIPGNTKIGTGFNLITLTTTGPDWILGTTADGRLRSYKINLDSSWTGYTLRETSWDVFDGIISPGAGVYFGHKTNGSLHHYHDADPLDGNSSDLAYLGTVDSSGWTQRLLSAAPGTVA